MVNEPIVTVVGNLTDAPDIRYLQSGAALASFTVASTPRTFDRQSNEWKEGEALFMRCSVWRDVAENVGNSLTKGMRVIVTGRLTQRSWEQDGQRRTSIELQVDEIGPSLRYATAQVSRRPANNAGFAGNQAPPANDWGAPNQNAGAAAYGQSQGQEPPF